jgi:hypothetical protein
MQRKSSAFPVCLQDLTDTGGHRILTELLNKALTAAAVTIFYVDDQ